MRVKDSISDLYIAYSWFSFLAIFSLISLVALAREYNRNVKDERRGEVYVIKMG